MIQQVLGNGKGWCSVFLIPSGASAKASFRLLEISHKSRARERVAKVVY